MKLFDDLPDLFYFGFYCPKHNENFNEYSQTILELKDEKENAINFFLKEFRKFLGSEDIVIVTVPPHNSSNPYSGIRKLAKQIVLLYPNLLDAVCCLERFRDSIRNRTIEDHLKSIRVSNQSLIKEKKVILIDDVLTTGASIQACSRLLLKAGVKSIKVIVLGKTMRNIEDAHYFIEQNKDEYIQETIHELNLNHSLAMQSYEMQQDFLKEEEINEHISVDEWSNEQHDYCDTDDEHYDIDEEAQQKHEAIDEKYDELLIEIFMKEQEEYSYFENSMVALDNDLRV